MLHLRISVPSARSEAVQRTLLDNAVVVSPAVFRDACLKPPGDVITCDVPREAVSEVIDELTSLGIAEEGSIEVHTIDFSLSDAAEKAERDAPGYGADALVWEEVTAHTEEEATLSISFLVFMIIATLISGIAVILDSSILVIGAMVVGPEFGPLAALAVAMVQRRRPQALRSLLALGVGFPVAIATTFIGAEILDAFGRLPADLDAGHRPFTGFIANPDEYSVIVAMLAGVAGMLSLTTSKSGPLIGVLVSVTTIPAAGNLAVAMAVGQWSDAAGSALQLILNMSCLVIAAVLTLLVQRSYQRGRLAPLRRLAS